MIQKTMLASVVLWPTKPTTPMLVSLVDAEGVVVGAFKADEPLRGDSLTRLVPDGHFVDVEKGLMKSLNGPVVRVTTVPFDTVVVTERQHVDLETRLNRLESSLVNSKRNEAKLREKLRNQQQEKRNEAVVQDEPADVPSAEKGDTPNPASAGGEPEPKPEAE